MSTTCVDRASSVAPYLQGGSIVPSTRPEKAEVFQLSFGAPLKGRGSGLESGATSTNVAWVQSDRRSSQNTCRTITGGGGCEWNERVERARAPFRNVYTA
eukprot:1194967-Prorocentrum_minimum.AAC.5